MKTKERILNTALKLFNREGVDAVTVRHIAAKMNISHGNLCYHYPNKNLVIFDLYLCLVKEFNELMAGLQKTAIDLSLVLASNNHSFDTFYKYRFLFLDFTHIMRENPAIKKHYRQLVKIRKEQFAWLISKLVWSGDFKKEALPGQYDSLLEQVFIIADFWLPSSEILFEGKETDRIPHYRNLMQALIVPILTPKGMKKFIQLSNQN
ncbi:MAG: TetR/AcrR family transcriptional regulator [Chitinophagales bacterium]